MPQAATHILIPLLIVSLFRDFYMSRFATYASEQVNANLEHAQEPKVLDKKKKNKKFPLHYVLIAGIGGIIPDLDIAAFWILNFFGFTMQ